MIYKDQVFTADELKAQEFADSEFISCRFLGTNLRFTSFNKCIFSGSDLSSVIFDITSFSNCSFPDSKLSNLDFTEVQMKDCNFTKTIIKNCVLQQLKTGSKNEKKKFNLNKALFTDADLNGTIFVFCDLKEANFKNANLENAVFERCNLEKANFSGSNISGVNFADSKIDKTVLDVEGFITLGLSKGFILEQIQKL